MKKISLVAASLLFASGLVAQSSFDKAVTSGTVSGDVTLYGENVSQDSADDAGFTSSSIGLAYETAEFNSFKAAVGFRGNHDFSEENDGDYDGGNDVKSIFHTVNISYANDIFGLTVGRQEIDLEWMGDFHESIVAGITAIPNTTIVLGYSNRIAVADADAVLEEYSKFNGDKGAYVLDVKYEGIEGLVVNPYYYNADDVASWYGLKGDYDTDAFGVTAHIASSSEDVGADGEIMKLEARANVSGIALSTGYITTDEDAGTGSMDAVGDNINPLEEGNQVYAADANTFYLSAGYEVAGFELGAMYGQTEFGDFEEKELNLSASYGITDNLSSGLLYLDVNADENNGDADYNKVALTLEYSF